jgi:hypothetical protein
MTCSECQTQIFDGELNRDAVVHVAGCEDCRALDREVRLNVAALAEMRDDVMPVRVAARKQWPKFAGLAAAAIAAVAVGLHSDKPLIPEPKPPRFSGVPQLVELAPEAKVDMPAPRKKTVAKRVQTPKAEAPLLVKFLTDDPDVVIYWLIDPVQGEQAL